MLVVWDSSEEEREETQNRLKDEFEHEACLVHLFETIQKKNKREEGEREQAITACTLS